MRQEPVMGVTPSRLGDVAGNLSGETPLHLAIGMFDGVHLGHRAVIGAAVRAAGAGGGSAGVLTFWPHPSALFRPENPTRLIQDVPTKVRALRALGVDAVITQPFTPDLAAVPAEMFLPWLKSVLPSLAAVYVGDNFRFGRGRLGNVEVLAQSGRTAGIAVVSAPRLTADGDAVSSTRIRQLLEAGEIAAANALLGAPYVAFGRVTPGKRLGRTIGFPTLNLPWSPGLVPRLGVYAMRVSRRDGAEQLPAVANFGVRPTVESGVAPRIEVHVLGDCPFGEGDELRTEWREFLRPETKFADLAALRAQIARDRDAAAAYFRA